MKTEKTLSNAGQFVLRLEHCPNRDIAGGYWQEPATPKKVTVEIRNLRDARSTFESWRDANGLGAGNMTRKCGEVRRGNGQIVGRFSFNGRFWNPQGKEVILSGEHFFDLGGASCGVCKKCDSMADCNGDSTMRVLIAM